MTDELDKFDLSAWEAPEPPANLADAVVARMGGTDVAVAMPEAQPRRRRAWLIAGVAAACLALTVGAYALIRGGTRHQGPSTGSVVADRAQTLTVGDGVRAELDPGAHISWRRDGGVLRVEQRAGAAAWRVSGDEQVWIDAGATVASVEASGASLRVEVKMNQADARLIGVTALTAMTVSMVTVVVYEGHVKVSGSHGQPTVIVQPGSTYTVTPPLPSQPEPRTVGASQPQPPFDPGQLTLGDLRIPAGETATIHAANLPVVVEFEMGPKCMLLTQTDRTDHVIDGSTASFDLGTYAYSVVCTGETTRAGSITVLKDDASRPLAKLPQVNPVNADGRTYRISFQSMIPDIKVSGTGRLHLVRDSLERTYDGDIIPRKDLDVGTYTYWREGQDKISTLILDFDQTAPLLQVSRVDWSPTATVTGETYPGAQLSVMGIQPPLPHDGRFSMATAEEEVVAVKLEHPVGGNHYYVLRSPRAVTVAVAGTKLDRVAIMNVMKGAGKRVAACSAKAKGAGTGKVIVKTTIAPDGSVSAATATTTFDDAISDCIVDIVRSLRFPKSKQGITFSFPFLITAEAACDHEAEKEAAMEAINMGQHALALEKLEASLACRSDPYVVQLAFMESCASGNSAKAQRYYKLLTPSQQGRFEQICMRQKPPVQFKSSTPATRAATAEDGFLEVFSTPDAKILIDGVDTGLTTPITGKQLPLAPGKHKVTFVIDDDRFTYPVLMRTGATERMSKDLQ